MKTNNDNDTSIRWIPVDLAIDADKILFALEAADVDTSRVLRRSTCYHGSVSHLFEIGVPVATKKLVSVVGTWGGYEDWIAWEGGDMPVDGSVRVMVVFREEMSNGRWGPDSSAAQNWQWGHDGDDLDIVAYRVAKETP